MEYYLQIEHSIKVTQRIKTCAATLWVRDNNFWLNVLSKDFGKNPSTWRSSTIKVVCCWLLTSMLSWFNDSWSPEADVFLLMYHQVNSNLKLSHRTYVIHSTSSYIVIVSSPVIGRRRWVQYSEIIFRETTFT